MTLSSPLVSICCITYNHKNFIREAIDGFLMQQTNFPIEIIIHDDASTDNTANIIHEYQVRYPNLIKPIIQTENQYSSRGFGFLLDMFDKAQGRYIALCEGDDYWTDPLKLQKQVDFLEKNTKFSICFHKAKILEDNELKNSEAFVPSIVSTIIDLAHHGNYIYTASCVFRNNTPKTIGKNYCLAPAVDYYLHMMNAQCGDIFYIDEPMSVYRVHENSVWSSKSFSYRQQKSLETYICILHDLEDKFVEATKLLNKNIYYFIEEIYKHPIEEDDWHISKNHESYVNSVIKIIFRQTHDKLEQSQIELKQTQIELKQTQIELKQTQIELAQSQNMIFAMESSKFWKLRRAYFRIKTKLKA